MPSLRSLAAPLAAALLLAAPAGASAGANPNAPVLRYGDRGPQVAALQQELRDLGYSEVGPVDGIFGIHTWLAVTAFQRTRESFAPGDVYPADLTALTAALAQRGDASAPIGTTVLAEGDEGPAVATLQGDLIQLGYGIGRATGYFGPVTAAALTDFQQRHGLPPTGVLDGSTLQAVLAAMGLGGQAEAAATAAPSLGALPGNLQVGDRIGGYTITRVVHLVATAYGPSLQDNYPYGPFDVFGQPLVPGDVAVDPSVIPLRSHLYVTGYTSPYLPPGGEFAWARDTGGAIQGDRIDVFINGDPQQVADFGIQRVTAYVLDH